MIESFIRFSERMNVDLPQPEGPMMAVTRLRWICIVTWSRAIFGP
jgi:hypothetical protein